MNAQPWLKSYPAGVRWDAPLDIASVQSILDEATERFGPLPALQFMDRRIPYGELAALANRAAAGLQKLGVGPGVHVGLYLPNTPHYVIAFFGVLKAGGSVVNFSPLDALRTLEFKIEDSETDMLVTLDLAALYPQAEKLLASTRLKRLVIGEFAEFALAPGPVKAFMTAQGTRSEVKFDEDQAPLIELTYNWDPEVYTGGRNFGHLAYRVDDIYATCMKLKDAGVTINRPPRDGHMAFIRTPDAISIELIQKGGSLPPAEPWASMPNTGVW